jgi:glycosyltransferase involved in cell wall biosynthesis
MGKLISVVIPVFNQERYIGECLDSVLSQYTEEVEVIIVNDGSSDSSAQICRERISSYKADTKLIDQKNSGSLISRTNGVNAATGEYILFVDSDDLLLDGAVEILLGEIHRKPHDLYLFNATRDKDTKKPFFSIPLEDNQVFTDDKYPLYKFLCGTNVLNNLWTKCIRKDLFLKAQLPEEGQRLTNGEDLYQIMDMVQMAGSVAYLDRVLYYYRDFAGGISRVFSPNFFPSEKIVCTKRLEFAGRWDKDGELIRGAESETYRMMRESARKIYVSDLPWKHLKAEMMKLRKDQFFIEHYMKSNVRFDRRDYVLKAPLFVIHVAKILRGVFHD